MKVFAGGSSFPDAYPTLPYLTLPWLPSESKGFKTNHQEWYIFSSLACLLDCLFHSFFPSSFFLLLFFLNRRQRRFFLYFVFQETTSTRILFCIQRMSFLSRLLSSDAFAHLSIHVIFSWTNEWLNEQFFAGHESLILMVYFLNIHSRDGSIQNC